MFGLSVREKHDLLFNRFKINFAEVPKWQVNGSAMHWQFYEKEGWNPKEQKVVPCTRKELVVTKLGVHGDLYRKWIKQEFLTEVTTDDSVGNSSDSAVS